MLTIEETLQRLHDNFRRFDTRPFEWMYAALTIGWGLSLLWPGQMFQTQPSFKAMAAVANEEAWGSLALCIGGTRIFGLMVGIVPPRLFAAFGGGLIWTFLWVSLYLSNGMTTGVPVYGVLSVLNLVVFIKLCRSHLSPARGQRAGI